MQNNPRYFTELTDLLPSYLNNITLKSKKQIDNGQHDFVNKTRDILQLINLQTYHTEVKEILVNLCEELHSLEEYIPHDYCLFTGRMRVIYTFLQVYESLQEPKYLNYAHSFFSKGKWIDYVMSLHNSNGLFRGKLGAFLGFLYLKDRVKILNLGNTEDIVLDEILKGLIIDNNGLTNFFSESNINSIVNLGYGNAGLIWFFTILLGEQSQPEIEEIIQSLLASLDGQWNKKKWNDNTLKISTITDHYHFINEYKNNNTTFFKAPKSTFGFWEGALGICTALINCKLIHKNIEVINKIETCLKTLEKSTDTAFQMQYPKELFYLFISLYEITANVNYNLKAIAILDNPNLECSSKISLLLYKINNDPKYTLDILPALNSIDYHPQNLLKNIQEKLVRRYYLKTFSLWNHLEEKYTNKNPFLDGIKLDGKFYQNFEKRFLSSSLITSHKHKKILKDCFKFEQGIRKNVAKYPNKILLKIKDIVQYSQADKMLNLEEIELANKKLVIADNVYLFEAKWNWFQREYINLEEIFSIPANQFYGLIKIKSNHEERLVLPLSENQVIFLEIFFEESSIQEAQKQFLENFEINSEIEQIDLEKFMSVTLEQFIFNRLVVEST